MLSFSPVCIGNALRMQPYVAVQPYRSCDFSVGNIYQWRAYFSSEFVITADMLVMHATYPGDGRYYTYPVGPGSLEEALTNVEADAKERGIPLRFCCVPAEGVSVLEARYGGRAVFSTRRDWADYLYDARDLIDFPGKRFHTQRNHLNRFIKDNPEAVFVPVDEDNLPRAMGFMNEYEHHAPLDKVIEVEEMCRAKELLMHALKLEQKAGFIDVGGTIVALAIGEVVGDTLYVHVEKARTDYAGAYQAIVAWFAAYACGDTVQYINREDDSGEDGLRYSKLAYRPIRLVDKYWVEVND